MEEKEFTLEQAFEELDKLILKMQEEDVPLEETFELYKKGVALVETCSNKIEKVEADIRVINAGQDA